MIKKYTARPETEADTISRLPASVRQKVRDGLAIDKLTGTVIHGDQPQLTWLDIVTNPTATEPTEQPQEKTAEHARDWHGER